MDLKQKNSLDEYDNNNNNNNKTDDKKFNIENLILHDILNRILLLDNIETSSIINERDELSAIYHAASTLISEKNYATLDDIKLFMKLIHDSLVKCNSTIKPIILRVIRILLVTPSNCDVLVQSELHWVIVTSLEKENEFVLERMQAFKIIKTYLKISPLTFPITFANSMVAIANSPDDSLRRVCLEAIRELSIVNTEIATISKGVSCMLEAILDPSTYGMSESMLYTYLYLLNDVNTRYFLNPSVDLRFLISPFTDFDTDKNTLLPKWISSKSAFVTIMRTFVGIIHLTSDELGLKTLISLLRDPKVSSSLKDVVLDGIIEIFEPLISAKIHHQYKKNSTSTVGNQKSLSSFLAASSSSLMTSPGDTLGPESRSKRSQTAPDIDDLKIIDDPKSTASDKTGVKQSGLLGLFSRAGIAQFASPPFKKKASVATRNSYTNSGTVNEKVNDNTNIDESKNNQLLFSRLAVSADHSGVDPLYNLLDSYASLICAAFFNSGIMESLCFLGTHGDLNLTTKSRDLLVNILRVSSKIFPESFCSEMLAVPSLVEFAAQSSIQNMMSRSHRASQILYDLSNAFSINPYISRCNIVEHVSERLVKRIDQSNLKKFKIQTTSSTSTNNKCIKTIKDLGDELTAPINDNTNNRTQSNHSILNLIKEIQNININSIDKNEFNRQMDASKIIGKDGKDPSRWDWNIVHSILESGLQNPERLNEALATKFVKRLSGFYRCIPEEKGFFANIEWDAGNLHYLHYACKLYYLLANDGNGIQFLNNDRRGNVFIQMSKELSTLVSAARNGTKSIVSLVPRNLFRMTSCLYSMAREYFVLIGRMTTFPGGRNIIDNTDIFSHLCNIGQLRALDYLSRTVINALAFTDCGFMSRHLIKKWTSSGLCSLELKKYIVTILRSVLYFHPIQFYRWGIDCLLHLLMFKDDDSDILVPQIIAILEEASEQRLFLIPMLEKLSTLLSVPGSDRLLTRLLVVPEGIRALSTNDWLDRKINEYFDAKCKYALSMELALVRIFGKNNGQKKDSSTVCPIAINLQHVHRTLFADDNKGSGVDSSSDGMSLESLVRIPWNIEVKLSTQASYSQAHSISSSTATEYIKVDTFLDISNLQRVNDINYSSQIVKVRGIVVDVKGTPSAQPIATNRIISNCLMAGVSPIFRDGNIENLSELKAWNRRKGQGTIVTNETDIDTPVTQNNEKLYDWSQCKPGHRQGHVIELGDNKFSVEIAGEPAVWIFSRSLQSLGSTRRGSDKFSTQRGSSLIVDSFMGGSTFRGDSSRSGGFVYLTEVQYHIKLESGLGLSVPIQRHLYGELARSIEGIATLTRNDIIFKLIKIANDNNISLCERKNALWSLGHIASSDLGYTAIDHVDASFTEWVVSQALTHQIYSFRCTFFYVLGLISRSTSGLKKLRVLKWECSPLNSDTAIAFPVDMSSMFQLSLTRKDNSSIKRTGDSWAPPMTRLLKPFNAGIVSLEVEILNAIVKMPGLLLYKEAKTFLEQRKISNPEVFSSRNLYVTVHRVLESYSFRLTTRREILRLFTIQARLYQSSSTNSVSSSSTNNILSTSSSSSIVQTKDIIISIDTN